MRRISAALLTSFGVGLFTWSCACGASSLPQAEPEGSTVSPGPQHAAHDASRRDGDIATRVMPPLSRELSEAPRISDELRIRATRALQAALDGRAQRLAQKPSETLLSEGTFDGDVSNLRPLPAWYQLWYGPTPAEFEGEPDAIEVVQLMLRREPWVELHQDGTFDVRWETLYPTPRGHVYWGVTLPDQLYALPRYRMNGIEDMDGYSRTHHFADRVSRLERPDYDASQLIEDGGGIVEVLVEQFDPVLGKSRLYESRFAYRRSDEDEEDPIYRRAATIVEGPFVNMPEDETFVISFRTDWPTRASLAVHAEADGPNVLVSEQISREHRFELRGLSSNQMVRYQPFIAARDHIVVPQGDWHFRTHVEFEDRFRFAVMSDSREGVGPGWESFEGTNARALRHFFREAWQNDAHFLVFAGDLIDGYTTQEAEWRLQARAWKQSSQYVGRFLPIFEGYGNHEVLMDAYENGVAYTPSDPSPEELFAEHFITPRNGPQNEGEGTPPYNGTVYSWRYGNSHFVMLNSDYWWSNQHDVEGVALPRPLQNRMGFIMDRQFEWLEGNLASARADGVEHIFVFTHHPAFPNSFHWTGSMYYRGEIPEVLEMRDRFVDILARHHTTALITGHEHNYTRLLVDESVADVERPFWSLITGGCGAPHYALLDDLPWSHNVMAYSAMENYVLVEVRGDRVFAEVRSESDELIDRVELTSREPQRSDAFLP